MNRFTFDSGRSRRRRRRAPEPSQEQQAPPPHDPFQDWPAGQQQGQQPEQQFGREATGWHRPLAGDPLGGGDQFGAPQPPEQQVRQPGTPQQPVPQQPAAPQPPEQEEQPAEEASAASIRPYAWTGGRTKTNYEFEMETLVSTSEWYRPNAMLRGEHQSIVEMCRHPRSVAEVSALLSVPLGVAKVLLADMAELGLITVHQTVTESGSAPHLNLMERVLSGLRRL